MWRFLALKIDGLNFSLGHSRYRSLEKLYEVVSIPLYDSLKWKRVRVHVVVVCVWKSVKVGAGRFDGQGERKRERSWVRVSRCGYLRGRLIERRNAKETHEI